MDKFCVFCGEILGESGICTTNHSNKKMCVNCRHSKLIDDVYHCNNSENMENAKDKMLKAATDVSGGFPFTIEVSPLPLKKPVNKCPKWELNEKLIEDFKNSFV